MKYNTISLPGTESSRVSRILVIELFHGLNEITTKNHILVRGGGGGVFVKKFKKIFKKKIFKKKSKKKKKKRSVFCMKAILVKITSRCNFGWVKLKALVDEGANTI